MLKNDGCQHFTYLSIVFASGYVFMIGVRKDTKFFILYHAIMIILTTTFFLLYYLLMIVICFVIVTTVFELATHFKLYLFLFLLVLISYLIVYRTLLSCLIISFVSHNIIEILTCSFAN